MLTKVITTENDWENKIICSHLYSENCHRHTLFWESSSRWLQWIWSKDYMPEIWLTSSHDKSLYQILTSKSNGFTWKYTIENSIKYFRTSYKTWSSKRSLGKEHHRLFWKWTLFEVLGVQNMATDIFEFSFIRKVI